MEFIPINRRYDRGVSGQVSPAGAEFTTFRFFKNRPILAALPAMRDGVIDIPVTFINTRVKAGTSVESVNAEETIECRETEWLNQSPKRGSKVVGILSKSSCINQ